MPILKVGLTGGIGSGKSIVCRILKLFGAALYDSDSRAKILMSGNTKLREQISSLFGPQAYLSDGVLNRGFIAQRAFADPALLGQLNAIVHPAVSRDFDQWAAEVEQQRAAPYIIKEAAILIESGAWRTVDTIVAVTAPEELRITRVMSRDGMSRHAAQERIAAQMSDAQRAEYANYTIRADDHTLVIPQLEELHRQLQSLAV